jgi:hypothetical protein
MKRDIEGAYCVELESDMLTIKGEPILIAPGAKLAKGTGFEGHSFFEASSIRKIDGKYYFVYSSELSHELCYAIADSPRGKFKYGGTLISNGDIGFKGNAEPLNYLSNTHGGLVEMNGIWYVFYHRHTNRHQFSRQGCAEQIEILLDGSIPQAEITSCGLNGKPLSGTGEYEARIACNLASRDGACDTHEAKKKHPYFTQSGGDREDNPDQYIANMRDGAWAGFKYFEFGGQNEISVTVRGSGGVMEVSTKRGKAAARIEIKPSANWATFTASFSPEQEKQALYFTFKGKGSIDFNRFSIK